METQGAAVDCNCNLLDGKWQIAPLIINYQPGEGGGGRGKKHTQAHEHNYKDILGSRGRGLVWALE